MPPVGQPAVRFPFVRSISNIDCDPIRRGHQASEFDPVSYDRDGISRAWPVWRSYSLPARYRNSSAAPAWGSQNLTKPSMDAMDLLYAGSPDTTHAARECFDAIRLEIRVARREKVSPTVRSSLRWRLVCPQHSGLDLIQWSPTRSLEATVFPQRQLDETALDELSL